MISLVIISGRSGSGKSTALNVLEDQGFYCIDNLPATLLPPLIERLLSQQTTSRICVSIDARNIATDLASFTNIINDIDCAQVNTNIIYLDSRNDILFTRFSETRRKHPLSDANTDLSAALVRETHLLEPIAEQADLSIDTSNLTIHQLRDLIRQRVVQAGQDFALLFQSFAFKHGVPVDSDFVFDVRCLPNPHWQAELRQMTGLDELVIDFLSHNQDVEEMLADIAEYLATWLPRFRDNNRSYLTVAIGCTGGQHRSVYMASRLAEMFSNDYANVQVRHRELPHAGSKAD